MTVQKYRIEGLSDLVFGLALSIGSLVMINQPVNNLADIRDGLSQFVFGFLIIVSVWVSYTNIISDIKVETTMDFRLNLFLLMLVAIEPYLLYLLGHNDPEILKWSSAAYAVDIGLIELILAALYHKRSTTVIDAGTMNHNRRDRDRFIVMATIFLVSALPFFWQQGLVFGINLRFVIWMFAIVPGMAFVLMERHPPAKAVDH
jgi:uncharacterized membrane protein